MSHRLGRRTPSWWPPLRVVESEHIVEPVYGTVRRTWLERLFSWPWRPWAATRRAVLGHVPSGKVYIIDPFTVVCHPVVAAELRERLADRQEPYQ